MKNWSWLLLSLLISASAHAQMYKWVGPNGKITYSDTPPPPSARQVEEKSLTTGSAYPALPFELAKAVKSNPVTLYTTAKCPPCDDGRNMLNTRGIPFTEKTVNNSEEIARLRQIGGEQQLPLLTVGSKKQQGFQSIEWDALLTGAGYPETNMLPRDFHNPRPESIVQKPKAAEPAPAANSKTSGSIEDTPSAIGNAPPGFRF